MTRKVQQYINTRVKKEEWIDQQVQRLQLEKYDDLGMNENVRLL